jgi:RNA polymerase sigma-70 factor (ECF subfamily)
MSIQGAIAMSEYTTDYTNRALDLYSDTVYRLAFTHMRTEHDAQDVFQEVFLALISKPRSFTDDEHLKAWLIRATINRCKSVKMSAWWRRTAPLEEAALESVSFAHKEENDLHEYLSLLSGKYRSVIHLFYGEEMTITEIANTLKAKESTVRTWLTRARVILREKIQEGGYFNEE